jgi:hypothetical protein
MPDRVQLATVFGLFIGSRGPLLGCERIGATTFPIGAGDSDAHDIGPAHRPRRVWDFGADGRSVQVVAERSDEIDADRLSGPHRGLERAGLRRPAR